ncbi:hypothetical protein IKP85_06570 [bacterium]|nr:hypothetical protein [bacterium]
MEDKDKIIAKLKAENERLKEEVEIRDNLSETFRKEALSWANIANDYQKDKTKLEQTLQEIKEIAEMAINGGYATKSSDYSEGMEIIGHYVLQLITKAEESEG